jgi:predicted nucleic acid-binding protein
VPEAVWREVENHRPPALQNTKISLVRCVPSASERVDAVAALYTLHVGEHEALCLCLEFPGVLLLTDDTAARLAAKTLAVEAHGTLGLLVRAIRRRQLSKARVLELLDQISERSTLHIRPTLLEEVIRQVSETPES